MRDEESEDFDYIRFLWTKEASLLTGHIYYFYLCLFLTFFLSLFSFQLLLLHVWSQKAADGSDSVV